MTTFEINDNQLAPLKGQVILITGASSGIGLGTTKLLLELGARIVCGDINPPPIEHENLTFQKTDVTSWQDLSSLFQLVRSKHNRLDHVFANAGVTGRTTYLDEKLDENGDLLEPTHFVLDINLKGVVNTVALALHHLKRYGNAGSIVLTASASSFQQFRVVDYTVAKHGVLGVMRGLTPLLFPHLPIRINCIGPSWTTTGLVPEGVIEALCGIGTNTPAQVAKSVAILMADDTRHGHFIYTVEGKYSEVENAFQKTAAEIVGEPSEDQVAEKLFAASDAANAAEGAKSLAKDAGTKSE